MSCLAGRKAGQWPCVQKAAGKTGYGGQTFEAAPVSPAPFTFMTIDAFRGKRLA